MMTAVITIVWASSPRRGEVRIRNGRLTSVKPRAARVGGNSGTYDLREIGGGAIVLTIDDAAVGRGSDVALVTVADRDEPFSFFLRDCLQSGVLHVADYRAVVVDGDDARGYDEIVGSLSDPRSRSLIGRFESDPEESYQDAARHTRDLQCPTWLGLGRDIRLFEAGFRAVTVRGSGRDVWDWIRPRFHGKLVSIPEVEGSPVRYEFLSGRGLGCVHGITRWLQDGYLPILNAALADGEVVYRHRYFVTLERGEMVEESIRGTNILVSDEFSLGAMLTDDQHKRMEAMLSDEIDQDEEPVIYLRVEVVNTATTPKYSFMRIPMPGRANAVHYESLDARYDPKTGFGSYGSGRVFVVASLDDEPVPQPEMSVLLQPGESIRYLFRIPHRPISAERAVRLSKEDYETRFEQCVRFWHDKLAAAAKVRLPEKRIQEMMQAGALHLDLVCYGNNPDGAVAPVVGHYGPIGSESSPIIQYLDSIGKHDLARRAIMYFIEKQHPDGFMQNFGEYMLETQAVLWTIGEHFRYTRDVAWVRAVRDPIVKACEYLIAWRERNKKPDLAGRGYGMLDGKVADPEDPYHAYMLNGLAVVGLSRAAEVLSAIGDTEAGKIQTAADELRADVLESLRNSIAESPIVPLSDGSWCPSVSPWPENTGPLSVHVEEGNWLTHGTATARDAIVGSMYLLLTGVVDPRSVVGSFIVRSFTELFYQRNVAFSQPYYSPHPHAHLLRGEVGSFLKEFYNGVTSLADRETYTFWEHYHHASPHKTHEEGWFLMRCRWMLYLEDGETLKVFPGIPRAWVETGRRIAVERAATYFGRLTAQLQPDLGRDKIHVEVELAPVGSGAEPGAKTLTVRIPHPEKRRPKHVTSGRYDRDTESVVVEDFAGRVSFDVVY